MRPLTYGIHFSQKTAPGVTRDFSLTSLTSLFIIYTLLYTLWRVSLTSLISLFSLISLSYYKYVDISYMYVHTYHTVYTQYYCPHIHRMRYKREIRNLLPCRVSAPIPETRQENHLLPPKADEVFVGFFKKAHRLTRNPMSFFFVVGCCVSAREW